MKKINITKWKEFKIGDLFSISKPSQRILTEYETGTVPLVASGSENNGVKKYCEPLKDEVLEKGHCITVSPVDGYAFYQANDFLGRGGAGSSINILRNENLTSTNALFLCTIIRRVCSKYSYNQMCSASKLSTEKILLPVTIDGTPDWKYMGDFMEYFLKKQGELLADIQKL